MSQEGFDFLGFHFHKHKSKKTQKLVPYMWPGEKAMKVMRKKSTRTPIGGGWIRRWKK